MNKWEKGIVRFFDDKKGRGYIISENKELYEVHYSAIEADKKWKTLQENAKVLFKRYEDNEYKIIKKVKEIE